MKALFDPLALKKLTLANQNEVVTHGKAIDAIDKKLAAVKAPMLALIAPYKKKLLDERVAQLPGEVRAVILKPEKDRTPVEEKIADDYFPILRIDVSKIRDFNGDTSERCGKIPTGYDFHLWNNDDGYKNMGDWIEEAAKAVSK